MSDQPSQNPELHDSSSSQPSPKQAPKQGLIRELWALLLVYGTLIILPLLTGIACES